MPIPVNIEDLLRKRKIESNRIKFKARKAGDYVLTEKGKDFISTLNKE